MKKTWLVVIGLVLVLAAVGLSACSPGGVTVGGGNAAIRLISGQQEGIWVNGEGKVTAVPDVAILSLGIEAQDVSVAGAQNAAADAMSQVMAALKNQGIADKDIQTQNFSIQKVSHWDNDRQVEVVTGYRVTNTVIAKVRQVAKTGAVIDAAAAAGGDLTRVNSVGFTVDDPTPYQNDARAKAVAAARAKAAQMADLAGVKLGGPTYVSESSYTPGPIYRADVAMAAPVPAPVETPVSPGELEITVNVQLVYAIAD